MPSVEFPYEPRYVTVDGVRMHYVETGSGRPFVFMHGNPTWSYLWRNVMPGVSRAGRCIAFDLVGFGKSDRPDIGYTYGEHYSYVEGFIRKLGLKDIVVVGHDWGGALGFRYALEHPDNVAGIAFMETFPFTTSWREFPPGFRMGFMLFRTPVLGKLLIMRMNVFLKYVMPAAVSEGLPKEAHENYLRMFPDAASRYPVWAFPNELPVRPGRGETFGYIRRIEEALPGMDVPMLLVTGTPGGIIPEERAAWLMRTLKDLRVANIGPGIHYLQEDNPAGIAEAIVSWAGSKGLADRIPVSP